MSVRAIVGWRLDADEVGAIRLPPGAPRLPAAGPSTRAVSPALDTDHLVAAITELARDVGSGPAASHALVLTDGWSGGFATLRQAVEQALTGFAGALPGAPLHLLTANGELVPPQTARAEPYAVAAAAWAARAALAAEDHPDALYVAVGPAASDLVRLVDGCVAGRGRSATERLLEGELVPSGALLTPVEALVSEVPLWDGLVAVVPGAATTGDVHLWRGGIPPATEGGMAAHARAGERLARAVGGDREFIDQAAVGLIAAAFARAQVERLQRAMQRLAGGPDAPVLVAGPGAFLAAEAARGLGRPVVRWEGADRAGWPPETAVAWLLAQEPDD